MNYNEIPMGLSGAFARNSAAMNNFTNMTEEEKRKIIDHTHTINSKQEMRAFVQNIAENKFFYKTK